MNALQAGERLAKLQERADALARVSYYLSGDMDWQDEVSILKELEEYAVSECRQLTEKLQAVQL